MEKEKHYRALEKMYQSAPINLFYKPELTVSHEKAEIGMEFKNEMCHSAGAVHGSIYFKMLDDAAFFAANSVEVEYFVVTAAFTVYLTRPLSSGFMRSVGKVVDRTKSQIIAESVVYDADGKEIGRGNGIFSRSRFRLDEKVGYFRL